MIRIRVRYDLLFVIARNEAIANFASCFSSSDCFVPRNDMENTDHTLNIIELECI